MFFLLSLLSATAAAARHYCVVGSGPVGALTTLKLSAIPLGLSSRPTRVTVFDGRFNANCDYQPLTEQCIHDSADTLSSRTQVLTLSPEFFNSMPMRARDELWPNDDNSQYQSQDAMLRAMSEAQRSWQQCPTTTWARERRAPTGKLQRALWRSAVLDSGLPITARKQYVSREEGTGKNQNGPLELERAQCDVIIDASGSRAVMRQSHEQKRLAGPSGGDAGSALVLTFKLNPQDRFGSDAMRPFVVSRDAMEQAGIQPERAFFLYANTQEADASLIFFTGEHDLPGSDTFLQPGSESHFSWTSRATELLGDQGVNAVTFGDTLATSYVKAQQRHDAPDAAHLIDRVCRRVHRLMSSLAQQAYPRGVPADLMDAVVGTHCDKVKATLAPRFNGWYSTAVDFLHLESTGGTVPIFFVGDTLGGTDFRHRLNINRGVRHLNRLMPDSTGHFTGFDYIVQGHDAEHAAWHVNDDWYALAASDIATVLSGNYAPQRHMDYYSTVAHATYDDWLRAGCQTREQMISSQVSTPRIPLQGWLDRVTHVEYCRDDPVTGRQCLPLQRSEQRAVMDALSHPNYHFVKVDSPFTPGHSVTANLRHLWDSPKELRSPDVTTNRRRNNVAVRMVPVQGHRGLVEFQYHYGGVWTAFGRSQRAWRQQCLFTASLTCSVTAGPPSNQEVYLVNTPRLRRLPFVGSHGTEYLLFQGR
ncbi:MAG: hypothetical protein MHM6MM_000378 [Cercozoa sp. M6MM]